jgi:ketosteroid isomerase-like protein
MYEAYNAGDHAAAIALLDPEVSWDFTDAPDGVVYNGRDEVLAFWAMLGQVWESMKIEVMSQEEQGEMVTNEVRAVGRGLGSGVEVDQAETHVWRVRDGKLVEGKAYINQGRASSA